MVVLFAFFCWNRLGGLGLVAAQELVELGASRPGCATVALCCSVFLSTATGSTWFPKLMVFITCFSKSMDTTG